MKKVYFQFTLSCLFVLFITFDLYSQVVVNLQQPPPNQWHVEDMWQLFLTNTANQDFEVYLFGTVEEVNSGIIFEATSASFTLEANYSGPLSHDDIEPADIDYPDNEYETIIKKTGTIPAGTYTICVYVRSTGGDDLGHDCKMQMIAHPSPPELINPVDEAEVSEELPVFLWLPPMPMTELISYTIKIVEVLDGQTPIEAIDANPFLFEETEIMSTSFQYSIAARPFEAGINYAWQVTAKSFNGFIIGESPVWSFNYVGLLATVLTEEPLSLILISPSNAEEIDTFTPKFEWTTIDTTEPDVTITSTVVAELSYTLKLWKLTNDLSEKVAEGIILKKNDLADLDPYFIYEEIQSNHFVYTDTTDHPLLPGSYAWEVTATINGQNITTSDVNSLTVKCSECPGRELNILTQNTFLRPTSFLLGLDVENEKRSNAIKQIIKSYDIIGLQEVFDNDLQKILTDTDVNGTDDCDDLEKKELEKKDAGIKVKDFPVNGDERELVRGKTKEGDFYFVMGPDKGGLNPNEDGGLIILSKLPIILASSFVFSERGGSGTWDEMDADTKCNKGALYARIDMEDPPKHRCYIHVFNTHTQAQNDDNAKKVRKKQFEELNKFISLCTAGENGQYDEYPVILMGDLNVVANKPENWAFTAGINNNGVVPLDAEKSQQYDEMLNFFKSPKLTDVWHKLRPKDPGITWIANPKTGWKTNKKSSWGTLGNVLADKDDKDPPARFDYFLYHQGGTPKPCLKLEKYLLIPKSINTVPSGNLNKKPYKFGDIISNTVSDHLGVEMKCTVGCK